MAEKEEQITRDVARTSYKIGEETFGCAMGEQVDTNIRAKMVSRGGKGGDGRGGGGGRGKELMRKWMCGEEDKERREVRKGGVSVVLLAHYCVCV